MAVGDSSTLMETSMKDNGKMTKLLGKASTFTTVGLCMKGTGLKTNNMALEGNSGLMEHFTKVTMLME